MKLRFFLNIYQVCNQIFFFSYKYPFISIAIILMINKKSNKNDQSSNMI